MLRSQRYVRRIANIQSKFTGLTLIAAGIGTFPQGSLPGRRSGDEPKCSRNKHSYKYRAQGRCLEQSRDSRGG